MALSLESLKTCLPADAEVIGEECFRPLSSARTIEDAEETSLVWISPSRRDALAVLQETRARTVVMSMDSLGGAAVLPEKCLVLVREPRLTYIRLLQSFFVEKPHYGIHDTALVHPDAEIDAEVYVGPYAVLGRCKVGQGSWLDGFCKIGDGTIIGRNVKIHSGVVIGKDGFGYSKNERGVLERFPHLGGVIIEDDVEIGANSCVDRGTLGNTILRQGVKIDNLVHVAHNVVIGRNSAVVAQSMIGGSVSIGDNAWIAPSVCMRDGVSVGDGAFIGLGALITKDVPPREVWAGVPAKKIRDV